MSPPLCPTAPLNQQLDQFLIDVAYRIADRVAPHIARSRKGQIFVIVIVVLSYAIDWLHQR